jgi:ABC-type uncharacterized transport system ATPase subunit
MEIETPGLFAEQIERIRGINNVCKISYNDPILRITCMHDHTLAENITRTLLSQGAKIRSINTMGPTLEEAFIKLTGGEEEIDRFLEKARME